MRSAVAEVTRRRTSSNDTPSASHSENGIGGNACPHPGPLAQERGKHAQFPEFSRPLVWNCFMGTHVGGYFLGGLNKNFCSPARSSVLIKSTPASNSAAQTSGLSGVAQNRTLRPCAWAFATIFPSRCRVSSGITPFQRHLKTLLQLSLTNGMREPGA